MIVYGSRSKQLAKEITTEKCANCDTHSSIEMYVFQRYAHVFWIPLFPVGKTIATQCNHCKQVLKQKEMSSSLKQVAYNLKSTAKTPIWMFSGLALLAILITSAVISDNKKKERNALLITAPQSGDVFEVRTEDNQYTLFKVEDVQADTVLVLVNNYQTNKSSGLSEIKSKGEKAYSDEIYTIARKDLKDMFDKGKILDINRK